MNESLIESLNTEADRITAEVEGLVADKTRILERMDEIRPLMGRLQMIEQKLRELGRPRR
jgi:hypothetical protein